MGTPHCCYASEAGIYLAGSVELAQDKRNPGLSGRYGVAEGLAALLANTGLQATPDT